MSTQYISKKDLHVTTLHGCAVFMEAGVPRTLPRSAVDSATAAGAKLFPATPTVTSPVELPDEVVGEVPVEVVPVTVAEEAVEEDSKVSAVVAAMRAILESGNLAQVTSNGVPRAVAVEEICGFDTDKTLRDAAWAIVEG